MYFVQHLFTEGGDGLVEHLEGDKFHKVVDKFIPLNTSNIWNLIAFFKHSLGTTLEEKLKFVFGLCK